MAKVRRKMVDFEIGEISAVDVPAQSGALSSLIKNATQNEESVDMPDVLKALSDQMVKRYIDPSEGVVSFATVLAAESKERDFWHHVEPICPYIYALECSLKSIAGTSDVDQGTKMTMMRNTVEDFMTVIRAQWTGAEAFMMSALEKSNKENDAMAKTTDDLQKEIAALTKKLADAEAAATKAAEEGNTDLQTKVSELEKQVGTLTAERDELAEKAAMSTDEKAYMRSLGKEERKAFMGMSAADRKKAMKKAAEDDEEIAVKGKTIRKSAVGEEMFDFLKAQQEENAELQKKADEEREKRETAEYTKRAEEDLGHLPGTAIAKAKALKALNDLPNEELSVITKMLEAGEKAIKGAFTSIGHRGTRSDPITKIDTRGDGSTFMKRVSEVQAANPNMKKTEAMAKARKLHPEEFEAYRNGGDA